MFKATTRAENEKAVAEIADVLLSPLLREG